MFTTFISTFALHSSDDRLGACMLYRANLRGTPFSPFAPPGVTRIGSLFGIDRSIGDFTLAFSGVGHLLAGVHFSNPARGDCVTQFVRGVVFRLSPSFSALPFTDRLPNDLFSSPL